MHDAHGRIPSKIKVLYLGRIMDHSTRPILAVSGNVVIQSDDVML